MVSIFCHKLSSKTIILFFLLFLQNNSFAENKNFFSGRLINDKFLTLIVSGDKAIIRKLNLNQNLSDVEYDDHGKAFIVTKQKLDSDGKPINIKQIKPQDNDARYEYFIPADQCYTLDSFYKICIKGGKVITVIKYDVKNSVEDYFFNENSEECNIFKFNIAYKIFTLNKDVQYNEYQVALSGGYPDFIKAVIVDYEQVMYNLQKVDFNKSKNLRIFFVSSNNDIGCIPYDKLKLYTEGEDQIYKMHIRPYRLVGPFVKRKKDQISFIEIDKSRVTKYDLSSLNKK